MSAEDMDTPTLRLTDIMSGAPNVSLEWSIGALAPGPDDRFLFLDTDGEPRLMVTADELMDLRDRAEHEVLRGGR